MTDNEFEMELQDVLAGGEEAGGEVVEIVDIVIPDPEPVPDMWAVTDMSYRAVLSEDDLQPGETLLVGERPVIQDQRANASQQKAQLLALAAEQIAPLQDAVDLDMATATEAAALLAWKKYRVLLNRVDVLQAPDIAWPIFPA